MQPRTMGPPDSPASSAAPDRARIYWAAGAIVLAGLACYSNTFSVPFFFDDTLAITNNPTIRHWWTALFPTGAETAGAVGRPVVNFTFALNYTVGGLNPWGYHAVNLLMHLLTACVLFGVVRRTLLRPVLSARFANVATTLAFAIALLWAIHPLQTESVTSVIERTELLMGFFYLLTLYCFICSVDSPRPQRWQIAAFVACLLGMGSKEVMATAPLLVLLYDRTFVAGTFRDALKLRRKFYLALAGTWLPLAGLVLTTHGRAGTAGFDLGVSWTDYALKQCEAVTDYLCLALWPSPLVLDYGTDVVTSALPVWPQIALLSLLLLGTLYALWRYPQAGFVGAAFFLILAPSSSILPLTTQTMAEHRMYLPLAAVLTLVVLTLYACAGRRTIVIAGALAVALGTQTFARNRNYRNAAVMWADTLENRPGNARAHYNYGCALLVFNRNSEALGEFLQTLGIDPKYSAARSNIGDIFAKIGRLDEAAEIFQTVLSTNPRDAHTRTNLGMVYIEKGDLPLAVKTFRTALQNDPDEVRALTNLGSALTQLGQPDDALPYLEHALKLAPDSPDAQSNYGVALLALRRSAEAVTHLERALALEPGSAKANKHLSIALADVGELSRALSLDTEAVRLAPDDAEAHLLTGRHLYLLDRAPQAILEFQQALRLKSDYPEAQNGLGMAYARTGRAEQALAAYAKALALRPDYAEAHFNFGNALFAAGQLPEAVAQYNEALRLQPDYPEAHNNLGGVLVKQGMMLQALLQFREALRERPDYADAKRNLDALETAAGQANPGQ